MPRACRSLIVVAATAGLALIAGCPLPLRPLGYEAGSRGNVPAGQPKWIVPGTTSREDVLLRLGTPDEQARDGRWIGYLSSRHEGGIALFLPFGSGGAITAETYTERRLVVWLDERGIVTGTESVQKECPRAGFEASGSVRSEHCLGFAHLEGFPGIREGAALPEPGTPTGKFGDVVWCTPFFDVERESTPRNFVAYRGPVIITGTALVASGTKVGGNTAGHVRLEFRDITDISRHAGGLMRNPTLVVTMADHVEYQFFAVQSGFFGLNDRENSERLITLLETALRRPARALTVAGLHLDCSPLRRRASVSHRALTRPLQPARAHMDFGVQGTTVMGRSATDDDQAARVRARRSQTHCCRSRYGKAALVCLDFQCRQPCVPNRTLAR
jgi:outer membrane protein assembly factor BamE (lipoprotein component of BamABCDE complex)